jgi:hypothetical protein
MLELSNDPAFKPFTSLDQAGNSLAAHLAFGYLSNLYSLEGARSAKSGTPSKHSVITEAWEHLETEVRFGRPYQGKRCSGTASWRRLAWLPEALEQGCETGTEGHERPPFRASNRCVIHCASALARQDFAPTPPCQGRGIFATLIFCPTMATTAYTVTDAND